MTISWALMVCCFEMCLLAGTAHSLDSTRRISQFAHTAWRLQDGYLDAMPTAIAQTKDGYLWIGTQGSLLRFDGVRFVPWVPPMGKQLPSQEIFSLLPEENGGLWIGTAEGLAHWTGNDLINYGSAGRINSIVRGLDGRIWVTRSRNQDDLGPLCEVDGEQLQCHGRADGISASHAAPLVQDSLGNFWMGSTDGLGRWQPGSTSLYLWPGLKYAHGTSGLESLAVAQDNSLWVGINRAGTGLGLERFTKGHPSSSIAKGFNGSRLSVNALFTDRDKDLWVGTVDEGIYRIRGSLIDHFGSSDGLSGDYINGFAQDNEGNLWVATSKGLDSLRDLPVATFSKRQGLTVDDAGSIVASSDGTILIGNSGALDLIADGLVSSLQTFTDCLGTK